LFRLSEGDTGWSFGGKSLRHFISDGYPNGRVGPAAAVVEIPPDPALGDGAIRIRPGLPNFGGAEMRAVWIWVANALANGKVAVVKQRFKSDELSV
jgi:hypothetical protein